MPLIVDYIQQVVFVLFVPSITLIIIIPRIAATKHKTCLLFLHFRVSVVKLALSSFFTLSSVRTDNLELSAADIAVDKKYKVKTCMKNIKLKYE